jgi:hypothetical protein
MIMKKAKVALTAIAVFAVVGGALAFKVRQNHTFYMTNPNDQNKCNLETVLRSTTAKEGQVTSLSTAPTDAECPQITITEAP